MKKIIAFLTILLSLTACSGTVPALHETETPNDPLESMNRFFFIGNQNLDRFILEPIAIGYDAVTPSAVRLMVRNEMDYITLPRTIANSLLQGDLDIAGDMTARLFINTFFGGLGLLDPAADIGLKPHSEDFGQTLAAWGVNDGFYLVIPLLGPTTLRDFAAKPVDSAAIPVNYIGGDSSEQMLVAASYKALDVIEWRAQNIATFRNLRNSTEDLYALTRNIYLQSRNAEIQNQKTEKAKNNGSGQTTIDFDSYIDE
jgi:phospholipid-binding lipoprotein MlaA